MPFDPLDYQPPPSPSNPSPRRLTLRSEAVMLYVVFGPAVLLLVLLVTTSGFADLVAYLRR
jgi:hypothetical protein